ncbi:MAG: ATP-binding cassette domain-containing protein [Gemmatimonadetes bacterium]|nr:ATP-binding cassette domain-containing protein [Gemmatimonadota bacterium]
MDPSPGKATGPAVVARGVSKRYGPVQALDGVHLEVARGEVHGVLGENGAGKTTLLGVLGGTVRADAGRTEVLGRPLRAGSPRDAWSAGVGLVQQHFTLVPAFTALENLALGVRGRGGGLRLPMADLRRRAGELMDRTGLAVPLDVRVSALGVGERQRVEILKALLRDPSVLLLDEPTAVLAPPEVERLLRLLRGLAREGRTVVIVAHKLDEVLAVADRVTVLRRGRTVLEAPVEDVDAPTLARVMVGEALARAAGEEVGLATRRPRPRGRGDVVASLRHVSLTVEGEGPGLRDVSLEVRRGEIVGVAGVEGNGQRELARVLAGLADPDGGVAELPADAAFVPQDRTREGLVAAFDVAANVALALARDARYRRGPFLRWRGLRRRAAEVADAFGVKGASRAAPVSALSGGNQQRVVVARELARGADLLVAENPVRGLDVAGAAFVHRTLRELRAGDAPPGVVLVSTDLDEVLALADRVLVMVRGRLVPVPEERRTREGVGAAMLSGA